MSPQLLYHPQINAQQHPHWNIAGKLHQIWPMTAQQGHIGAVKMKRRYTWSLAREYASKSAINWQHLFIWQNNISRIKNVLSLRINLACIHLSLSLCMCTDVWHQFLWISNKYWAEKPVSDDKLSLSRRQCFQLALEYQQSIRTESLTYMLLCWISLQRTTVPLP